MTDNRSWTLPRQHNLLSSHLGKFKEHQVAGTLSLKFWPRITRKFFKVWKSQDRERREWEILKGLVEGGQLAVPTCLGGGNDEEARRAGLDIGVSDDREGGDKEGGDDDEQVAGDTVQKPADGNGSELSSDDEELRAANEAALVNTRSIPAPQGASGDGSSEQQPKKKRKAKKKKQIVITVPDLCKSKDVWKAQRVKQIQRWYYNATATTRKTAGPKVTIDFKGLFSNAIGGRALTEAQMYSKMYYESRFKEGVDAKIAEENLSRGERIAFTAKRLQEAYEDEEDDVKEAVRAELRKAAREKEEAMTLLKEMMESGGEREQTPEEYARIQTSLRPIIQTFFDILGPLSGYAFLVVGGGPKSENLNGAMGYVSYNRGWGDTRNDFTFNRWYDGYHERLVKPFGNYCHELFTEEYRLQRAITIGEAPNLSLDALKRSGRNFGKLQSGGEIQPSRPPAPSTAQAQPSTSGDKGAHPKRTSKSSINDRKGRKPKTKPTSSSEEDDSDDASEPSDPSENEPSVRRRKATKATKYKKGKGKAKAKRTVEESLESGSEEEKSDKGAKANGRAKGKRNIEESSATDGDDEEDDRESGRRNDRTKEGAEIVDDETDREGVAEDNGGVPGKGSKQKRSGRKKAVVSKGRAGESDDGDDEIGKGVADKDRIQKGKSSRKASPVKRQEKGSADGNDDGQRKGRRGRKAATAKHMDQEDPGDDGDAVDGDGPVVGEGEGDADQVNEEGGSAPEPDTSERQEPFVDDDAHQDRLPRLPPPSPLKRTSESQPPDEEGRQKRQRRSRMVEEWVTETKPFLLRCMPKVKAWEEVVDAWFDFETLGFKRPMRVSDANARPQELKRWLTGRRGSMPQVLPPVIDDMEDYRERWMSWWAQLKVEGGSGGSGGVRATVRKAGPMGVVTILYGLAFWSAGRAKDAEWKRVTGELLAILKPE